MNALQQTVIFYKKHGMNLAADIEHYANYGFVFITPDRLLLARPLDTAKGVDTWLREPEEGDAWFVKMALGRGCLKWFLQQAPFHKPFLAWHRMKDGNAKLHIYQTDRFLTKV